MGSALSFAWKGQVNSHLVSLHFWICRIKKGLHGAWCRAMPRSAQGDAKVWIRVVWVGPLKAPILKALAPREWWGTEPLRGGAQWKRLHQEVKAWEGRAWSPKRKWLYSTCSTPTGHPTPLLLLFHADTTKKVLAEDQTDEAAESGTASPQIQRKLLSL